MSAWTAVWIAWLGTFVGVEGWALFNKAPSDTFSETVWTWFKTGPSSTKGKTWSYRTIALGAFLVWLTLHLTFGWFR